MREVRVRSRVVVGGGDVGASATSVAAFASNRSTGGSDGASADVVDADGAGADAGARSDDTADGTTAIADRVSARAMDDG